MVGGAVCRLSLCTRELLVVWHGFDGHAGSASRDRVLPRTGASASIQEPVSPSGPQTHQGPTGAPGCPSPGSSSRPACGTTACPVPMPTPGASLWLGDLGRPRTVLRTEVRGSAWFAVNPRVPWCCHRASRVHVHARRSPGHSTPAWTLRPALSASPPASAAMPGRPGLSSHFGCPVISASPGCPGFPRCHGGRVCSSPPGRSRHPGPQAEVPHCRSPERQSHPSPTWPHVLPPSSQKSFRPPRPPQGPPAATVIPPLGPAHAGLPVLPHLSPPGTAAYSRALASSLRLSSAH